MASPGDGFKFEPVNLDAEKPAHRPPSSANRGPTLRQFLFVCCLFGIPFLVIAPDIEGAEFRARVDICRSNLREIGKSVQSYRATHGGRVPPDVNALVKNAKHRGIFTCPQNWKTPYVYRASDNPGDIICWDGAMHFHARYLLSNAIRNRNVLFGNGEVRTINEDDFRKLHLKGTPISPESSGR